MGCQAYYTDSVAKQPSTFVIISLSYCTYFEASLPGNISLHHLLSS